MRLGLQDAPPPVPVTSIVTAADAGALVASEHALLAHDERHLRRRILILESGRRAFLDLAEPVMLRDGDVLRLEDETLVAVRAAPEELLSVRARSQRHLTELAWHIGNRHLAAAIEDDRLLILRDHVIKAMLEGLGAMVDEIVAPFEPARGAYSGHTHGHGHHHHG